MKIRFLILAAVAYTFLLTGCVNQSELEKQVVALSGQVDNLSYKIIGLQRDASNNKKVDNRKVEAKIKALQNEIGTIFASSVLAYDEAIRANSRIDNMAQSYTK